MRLLARHSRIFIIILLMLVAIFFMRAPHMGWRVHTVVSGSMQPVLEVGEVAVTKQVDPATIREGDIIAFHYPTNGQLICHRVIGVKGSSSLYFHTKGDANERPDAQFIPAENVVGKVRFHTPLLAHISSAVRSPMALVMVGALCMGGVPLRRYRRSRALSPLTSHDP